MIIVDDRDLSEQVKSPDLYDLYDLYDLVHVAGREPNNLHDPSVAHISCLGSALHRSCTTSDDGKLGSRYV